MGNGNHLSSSDHQGSEGEARRFEILPSRHPGESRDPFPPWVPAFAGMVELWVRREPRGWEEKHMRQGPGWLATIGFLASLAVANAQTPPVTKYDGTYAFSSSTQLNETFTTNSGRMGQCAHRIAGPLTIVNGRARYSGSGLRASREFEGTVGSQGELAMRSDAPGQAGNLEITLYGRIDGNGTVTARQSGVSCHYDFIWQKKAK